MDERSELKKGRLGGFQPFIRPVGRNGHPDGSLAGSDPFGVENLDEALGPVLLPVFAEEFQAELERKLAEKEE